MLIPQSRQARLSLVTLIGAQGAVKVLDCNEYGLNSQLAVLPTNYTCKDTVTHIFSAVVLSICTTALHRSQTDFLHLIWLQMLGISQASSEGLPLTLYAGLLLL